MEELKPKIKPKAPASLKKNVLSAIQQQERPVHRPRLAYLRWFSAAAVVIVGILTFTIWEREYDTLQPTNEVPTRVSHEKKTETPSLASSNMVFPVHKDKVYERQRHKRKAKRYHQATQKEELPTPIIESPIQEEPLPPLPNNTETIGIPPMELTAEEQQLIENMEEHRYLIRAYLAEELMQAAASQRRIERIRKDYMQDAQHLYEDVYQYIQKEIESIGQTDEKKIQEV